MVLSIIISVLGILSTVLAWYLNPRRRLYAEIDSIYRELESLYHERDEALAANDSDGLSLITDSIVKLCERKTILFQRF